MAAFCSLIFFLKSPECLAQSNDKKEEISWCEIISKKNTGSYSDGNKLYYTQESVTKKSKDPNLAILY